MLEKSSLAGGANMRISSETIESILRQEDLEGLLNLGAPQDEYSSEAREMATELQAVHEPTDQEEVSRIVMAVWERAFGPFSDEDIERRTPVLRQVVKRILGS